MKDYLATHVFKSEEMKKKFTVVIFTDLDGSLLHRDTFQFDGIKDYIKSLVNKGVIIIPNSSKTEKEMIIVATSAENNCLYCVVAHGAILRIYERSAMISDQIAVNYRKADITERQRAMLDFAVKVCNHSAEVDENDFIILKEHDFTDDDIWDIAGITALFGLSNRLASITSIRPNDEFYHMGRT